MDIKSKDIKIVPIDSLIANPKNNNSHPKDQIERLAKIIKHQGFRTPIVVSNRSGFVVCGHGRIEAAKIAGMTEVPVSFQDFENEAQEYAHMTADNAIQEWSTLDLSAINRDMLDLGPELDLDLLGLKDFALNLSDLNYGEKNKEINTDNFGNDLLHMCPKCGFEFNE